MKSLFFVTLAYSFEILRPLQKAMEERGDEVRWYIQNAELKPSLAAGEVELTTLKAWLAQSGSVLIHAIARASKGKVVTCVRLR